MQKAIDRIVDDLKQINTVPYFVVRQHITEIIEARNILSYGVAALEDGTSDEVLSK